MVAETSSAGRKLFPEIRIHLRTATRSSQIGLSPVVQAGALAAVVTAGAALSYLGISRIGYDRLVADKEAAVVRAETANADLQDDLASLQDRLAATTRDRQEAEGRLSALSDQAGELGGLLELTEAKLRVLEETGAQLSQQRGEIQQQLAVSEEAASSKAGRIAQLTRALDQAQREVHQLEAQRATLVARLSKNETDRLEEQARYAEYKASLEQTAKKLQQLGADRDKAASERDLLRARIGELEQKLSQRETPRPQERTAEARPVEPAPPQPVQSEIEPPHAEIRPTDARAEPKRGTDGVAELGRGGFGEFERVLASTGIDIARLFSQFGLNRAEGGPFVAPPKTDQAADGISPDRLAGMRGLVKSLPLGTPIDHYQVGSRFGPQFDPFNGKAAFHTGLDFTAPYMSPIYATAPGIVTYAGYRGDYGKVVEIDHGNGIATVYAHMHRYTVSVGQTVEAHAQIGFLGSTGRASGPHVHYEVIVNGEPQDPEKFIALARLIPIAEK